MSAKFNLDDYVTVAERVHLFLEKYPEGSLQRIGWEIQDVSGHLFVVYTAAAYRTPDDPRPGIGTAWEPFPGTTPYTAKSELMNAETAAWGRAIVALGIAANRGIASREEVRNRSQEHANGGTEEKPTDKQLGRLQADIRKNNPPRHVLRAMVDGVGGKDIQIEHGWLQKLSRRQVSGLIDTFANGVLPDPQAQDIPNDFETPEAVPVGAGEELPFDA